ncbi:MAG: hypothetical protein PHP23_12575, partial [Desulfobacterales bacterium]|nr:hypothetical protein [Desulfobacterales bacterium]MDD4073826.1 hypothetical protein [Desulfobacterales bacterium]MDD4429695.1 hypothetical protein [Paludibacter sp.]
MNIALFIAQVFLVILMGVGINYIRKLPDRLHKEGVLRYEYGLKNDLEAIKASLTQENEFQTIRYQESQARMAEQYIEFMDYFNSIWTDKKVQKEIASNPKKQLEFNKKMRNYSAKKQKVAKKRLDRVFLKNFKIQLDMTLLSYSDNNESDR